MSTLVIAEAGVNHNGDVEMAKKLISQAARTGADLVKFQTFVSDRIVAGHAPKASYQEVNTDPAESHLEMLRKLELSRADHEVLIAEAEKNGIGFFSTAFDSPSLDLLVELGIGIVKVPSGEITNLPFLRHAGRLRLPVLLSTGMATLAEIEAAVDAIEQAGTTRDRITLLHCTTAYPTKMEDVNLRAMSNMAHAFGVKVGYSDHTPGIEVALAAVALGATVIEKHFTLDRDLPGPDHSASLAPAEFQCMVEGIRNIERAMGDGIKRPAPGETKNRMIARKSLVASCPIAKGERFGAGNMVSKRPGTGISPMRWDEVCGRSAPRDFLPDELIEL